MSVLDFSVVKKVEIPEGEVIEIGIQTNQVPKSIDTDGSIFNASGYIMGYRLSSTGELKAYTSEWGATSAATGFIPAKGGDVIRVAGCWWYDGVNALHYICAYDTNFNFLGATTADGGFYIKNIASNISGNKSIATLPLVNDENIAYIRVSCTSRAGSPLLGANMIVLNDHIFDTIWEYVLPYTNQVPISVDENGAIYNGVGYKNGYRVRSGGAEAAVDHASCTGFIPLKAGDIVRMSGYNALNASAQNAINVYNVNYENLGQVVGNHADAGYGIFAYGGAGYGYGWNTVVENPSGVYVWVVPPVTDIAFMRVTGFTPLEDGGTDGSKMIVTVNERIADEETEGVKTALESGDILTDADGLYITLQEGDE